jgi:hypothetical protein
MMLADFISGNREEIVTRYRSKAEIASLPVPLDAEHEYTVLAFIEELLAALRNSQDSDAVVRGTPDRYSSLIELRSLADRIDRDTQ